MQTYAIGDVQGCFIPLQALVKRIQKESKKFRLLFTGDIVNRGPQSLEALRYVKSLGKKAVCVLGNHDLHLLAIAAGIRNVHPLDTVQDILEAPDKDELIDWLRSRPLAHMEGKTLLVHAGLLPQWSVKETLRLAKEVERALRSDDWKDYLKDFFGNKPNKWKKSLVGKDRLRCIVNGLTRLRFCKENGEMEFASKGGLESTPKGYVPWYEVKKRKSKKNKIIFGHWSALGLINKKRLLSLDTGCIWGRELSAVRLKDRKLFQVDYDGKLLKKPRKHPPFFPEVVVNHPTVAAKIKEQKENPEGFVQARTKKTDEPKKKK